MQNFVNNYNKFSQYVKGKRIIIVGPSNSLENKNLGKEIDKYDIVIRLNNSYPIFINKENHRDIGTRTDVLYHTGAIRKTLEKASRKYKTDNLNLLRSDKIKFFVLKRDFFNGTKSERNYVIDFNKIVRNTIKIVLIEKRFLNRIRRNLNSTDPNISTLAITHLRKFEFKSCRIIGCDFYQNEYHKSYFIPDTLIFSKDQKKLIRRDGKKRRRPKIPHDFKTQIRFLFKILKNDKRFKVDDIKVWRQIIDN
jgi:hypothetical protein